MGLPGGMTERALLSLDSLKEIGQGLNRPECVLAHESGLLFAPDWTETGGVSVIAPGGRVSRILARNAPEALKPNGIALEPGGSFLLAHLGAERGALYRLSAEGEVSLLLDRVEGEPLPPANFVTYDRQGRLWLTVSTRLTPRARDYRADAKTGFIALLEDGKARIVADGLGYTNECLLSPDGKTLYVNETFGRRLSAFEVGAGGALANKRTLLEFAAGTFPDGLALDCEGGIWIVSIVSNRVLRLAPDGRVEAVLEDCDPAHLAWVEEAYREDRMDRPHLDQVKSRRLKNISNLAFGGPGLTRGFLGCLLGQGIFSFDSPVAGAPPAHWSVPLGPLERYFTPSE